MSSPDAVSAGPPIPRPLYDERGRLGAASPGPASVPSLEYKPLRGRGRAAALMLGAIMVIDLAAVGSGMLELDLLQRLEDGVPVSDAELTSNDSRQAAIGITQMVFYLLAAIVFIAWFHRAYRNVDAVAGPWWRNHGTGWAIGGWFVPILAFWRPKQIANDIWRASAPVDAAPRRREPGWLLRVWWIGFIATWILGRIAMSDSDEQTPEEFQATTKAFLASDALDFVVAALAIVVIRQVTRQMDAKGAAVRRAVTAPDEDERDGAEQATAPHAGERGSGEQATAPHAGERGSGEQASPPDAAERATEDAGGRASVAQPWSTPPTT